MSDPTGTQGLRTSRSSSDLDLALEGGADFMVRLKMLGDKKDAAEAAHRALALGNDIAKAKADADVALRVAKETTARAEAEAQKIRSDATALRTDAQAMAEKIIAEANKKAEDITAAAAQTMRDADAYATATRSAAATVLAKAQTEKETADRLKKEAEVAASMHATAMGHAEKTSAEHEAKKTELQSKLDRLHAVLAELGA